jgi:hypothetical protein
LIVDIITPENEKLPYKKVFKDGLHKLYFYPVYEGQYKIDFSYDNKPILNAPLLALTTGYSLVKEVKVYGNGIYKSIVNKESEFFIDCNGFDDLDSFPEITFTGFSTDLDHLDIKMERLTKNLFKCSYKPDKPGLNLSLMLFTPFV